MIVLDTKVLTEPLRPSPDGAVLTWLKSAASDAIVTSVSIGELWAGAHRLPEGRRREALLSAIENIVVSFGFEILDYDTRAARIYARLQGRRSVMGGPLSVEDGMIAAICITSGAILATRNVREFDGLGLELANPWLVTGR